MKYKQLVILICCLVFAGCGNTSSEQSQVSAENIVVENENTDVEDQELQSLLDDCTGFALWYGYTMNQGGAESVYKLELSGDVVRFTVLDKERNEYVDYTTSKFDELKEIVKSSNPKLYDINDHVDEKGRIIYETLNPALKLYVPGEEYFLDVENTSNIEDFFSKLMADNDFGELNPSRESSSSLSKDIDREDVDSQNNESAKESGTYALASTGGIRVRAEANTDSEIVSTLQDGDKVTVLYITEDSNWLKIEYNGVEGYVPAEYMEIVNERSESNDEANRTGTSVTLTSTINIRSAPDNTSSKVAVAYAGEEIVILQENTDGWTLVQYGNKQGYVRTDLLLE